MQTPTFFEGPEKKVELVLEPGRKSLRSYGDSVWSRVVETSRAQILNVLRSDACDAYMLSESSLFVYDSHLTMITCGRTRLVDAAIEILSFIPKDDVALLIYERKNEHFPDRQPSTFYEDAARLNALLPGRAVRFGDEHDHHVHLFHTSKVYAPDAADTTLEILMHSLSHRGADRFIGCTPKNGQTVAQQSGIADILPGFDIDEHPFTPAGYSMNALRGGSYFTIHVTPEELGSYVSFETNVDFRGSLSGIVSRVLNVFEPRSFDIVTFAPSSASAKAELAEGDFVVKDVVETQLVGYDVRFVSCYKPNSEVRAPAVIPFTAGRSSM